MSALVVQGTEIGVMRKGEFVAYTNFVFDVTAAVDAPEGYPSCSGFIYSVKTKDTERFVNRDQNGIYVLNPNGPTRFQRRVCLFFSSHWNSNESV